MWASDATTQWSDSWVAWDGYAEFWTALVRDTLPGSLDASPSLVYRDGKIEVTYTPGVMPSETVATAQVRAPNGELLVVPLARSGNSEYSGAVRAPESGAYWVAVSVSGADGVLAESATALVAPYSDEFAFRDPDPTLLPDITELTDGRIDPTAAAVWDPPQRGTTNTDLAPLLVLLALVLFFADIVLRRLVVQRGDAAVWEEGVSLQTAPVEAIRTDDGGGGGGEDDAPTVSLSFLSLCRAASVMLVGLDMEMSYDELADGGEIVRSVAARNALRDASSDLANLGIVTPRLIAGADVFDLVEKFATNEFALLASGEI